MAERYVDVILPLAVPGIYTYAVPEGLAPLPGARVVVPFGTGRKLYSALVHRCHEEPPAVRRPRTILSVLDEHPLVRRSELEHWQALAAHYMCNPGEVMIAALPGALVLSSETRLMASHQSTPGDLDSRQTALLHVLQERHVLTMSEVGEVLGLKDPASLVGRMMDRGLLLLEEELQQGYKPRTERFVRLAPEASSEAALQAWFDQLEKAPKQLHALMRFIELSRCLTDEPRSVRRQELLASAGITPGVLNALVQKGLFVIEDRAPDAAAATPGSTDGPVLSPAQGRTLEGIREAWKDHAVTLLQGVTASGKTEIYIELVRELIAQGRQVLYLLPEIALTTQVITRLRRYFGEQVAVYHSRLTQRERSELWMRMLDDQAAPAIVLGARSAMFLPFRDLGLIVVDEEHDPSYKQHDPAPRYHARDMAIMLAGIHGAKVVLGSATPSMESLHQAHQGKYGHVVLNVRYGDATRTNVVRIDLRDAHRRKQMRGNFSTTLLDAMQAALARKEQVIIFQNRRGYAPVWQCETCGWVPECDQCDASLTYHKHDHTLRCHYCGRTYPPPSACGSCGGRRLRMLGLGTEKIEEELQLLLPEARIARMDQDSTRGRHAFERLLDRFASGQVDVLVGTQMVTKGLDLERVSVVGILHAENLMRHPDFRAHERAFQLMAQVAGRAGRRGDQGTLFIQARDIHHPLLELVVAGDVEGFHQRELEHRRAHGYPPFTRLVRLTLKHRSEERVQRTADALYTRLLDLPGIGLLGPEAPPVSRIRDLHLRQILVKLPRAGYRVTKERLSGTMDRLFAETEHRPVRLVIDVDPY
ncbi:MAG: primosomal protein N' [Flavobacteriales bacterium]|nr:primosomal protein N' [Flavobacteriales bacterium]